MHRKPQLSRHLPVADSDDASVDLSTFDEMFAERDVKIAELQHAVVELSHQDEDGAAVQIEALSQQLAKLEARTFEQERTIRQTLSMLIEWIESEMDRAKLPDTSEGQPAVNALPSLRIGCTRRADQRPVRRCGGLVPGRRIRGCDRPRRAGPAGRPGRPQRARRSWTLFDEAASRRHSSRWAGWPIGTEIAARYGRSRP